MQTNPKHYRLADLALAAVGAALVIITLVAVFFRYVVNHSLPWSDEVVRYLFVWFTMLGAAVSLRECEHIRVEYFIEMMPAKLRKPVETTIFILVLLLQLALLVLGTAWVWSTRGSKTSALQLPLNLVFYAALPTTLLLSLYYTISRLMRGKHTMQDHTKEEIKCNS